MRYLLLVAVITLSLSACDLFRTKDVGEGKPGQYPPSLWDKRDSAPPGPEDDVGPEDRHEAPAE